MSVARLLRRRSQGDQGSALILALIVVVAVGIMLAAVIDFAGTGLTSGIQLRNLRNQNYYAEGAVDAAINNIRGSSTAGLPGSTCDYTPPNPSAGVDGASTHTYPVTCTPQSVPGGLLTDQPQYAILTLGPKPGAPSQRDSKNNPEGINSDSTGGQVLNIDGGVYSHGEIAVNPNSSSMVVDGSVHADGACVTAQQISTTDSAGPQCNVGGSASGLDPGYQAAVSTISDLSDLIGGTGNFAGTGSAADPTPICPHSGVAQFSPGYYTELPGTLVKNYSEKLSGANQCTGTEQIWWFQPGVYVFAYSGTWTIGNGGGCGSSNPCGVQVVGGTPTSTTTTPAGVNNWSLGAGQPQDDWNHDPLVPACVPSVDATNADGVQFNFSGGSNIAALSSGKIELCGPTAHQPAIIAQPSGAASQHIVLDGISQSISPQSNPGSFFTASSAPALGGVWTTTDAIPVPLLDGSTAQTPDNQLARATLIKGQSATLTYSAFSNIPRGARVQTACLRVYQQLQNGTSASVSVSTTTHSGGSAVSMAVPNSSDAACPAAAPNPYPSVTTPFVDMDISSAMAVPLWKDVNSTQVVYTANGPTQNNVTGTADVDALVLYVTYTMPQVVATTCTPASNCVLWTTTVNLLAFLHGTAYAPTAELDVEVQGVTNTIFDRGVVCETLWVKIVASSTQTTAPFRLPKATPNGRLVLLTASVDADARVRACVLFQDFNIPPGESKTAFPGYAVTIQSWNVFHGAPSGTPSC